MKVPVKSVDRNLILVLVICTLSIISMVLVHPLSDMQFIHWMMIPPSLWVRFIFAIVFTAFIPGYLMLNILFVNRIPFTKPAILVISHLLSVFLIPIVVLISLALGFLPEQNLILKIVLLNFGLLFCVFLSKKVRSNSEERLENICAKGSITDTLLLAVILSAVLIGVVIIVKDAYPLYYGDEWWHYGLTRYILQHGYISSIQGNYAWPQYAWWYYYFLATVLCTSGLPHINAYVSLLPLIGLPLVAFYVMASGLCKENSRIPIYATLFSTFGGYGWIYALYLVGQGLPLGHAVDIAAMKTYDIWIEYFFYTRGWYPFGFHIGLASLFMLIFLFFTKEKGGSRTYLILVSIIFATGFLSHVIESMLAILIIGSYAVIFEKDLRKTRMFLLAILAGLLFVGLIDRFYPGGLFYSTSYYQPLNPFFVSFGLTSLFFLLTFIFPSIKSKLVPMIKINIDLKIRFILVFILLYFYILSFYIWNQLLDKISIYWAYTPSMGRVPLYFYPIILGVTGTFGLFYIILRLVKPRAMEDIEVKARFFPVWWALIIFITAILLRNVFFERRMIVFLFSPLTIMSSIALLYILNKIRQMDRIKKKVLITAILAIVIICGELSPVMQVEHFSRVVNKQNHPLSVSDMEMQALEFLSRRHLPNFESVATVTSESHFRITTFAGVSELQVDYPTNALLFRAKTPQTAFYILSSSNITYMYLDKRDYAELGSEYPDSFMGFMMQYLPVLFNNSEVTIYYIPKILYSSDPDIGLIIPQLYPNESDEVKYFSYISAISIALSGKKFRIFAEDDESAFNCDSLIIIKDPNDFEKADKYLRWVMSGKRLTILNIGSFGYFASLFSISQNKSNIFIDSAIIYNTQIKLPRMEIPQINASQSVKIGGYFAEQGIPASPFIFEKVIGKGIIRYIEATPLLLLINRTSRDLLLSLIASSLQLKQLHAQNLQTQGHPAYEYATGSIVINGTIKLNAEQISFIGDEFKSSEKTLISVDGVRFQQASIIGIESEYPAEVIISSPAIEIKCSEKTNFITLTPLKTFNLTINSQKPFKVILKYNREVLAKNVNMVVLQLFQESDENFEFLIKTNELNINGTLKFQLATLYRKPHVLLCYLSPVDFHGSLILNLFASESDLLVFEKRVVDGVFVVNEPWFVLFRPFVQQVKPYVPFEKEIPWMDLLSSHMAFSLLVLTIILTYSIYYWAQRAYRIQDKSNRNKNG